MRNRLRFSPPRLRGEIFLDCGQQLWTCAAACAKFPALTRVVAASGERVHVVQRPDDGQFARNSEKKLAVIHERGNPVELQDVAWRELLDHFRAEGAAVVAKKCRSWRPRSKAFPAPRHEAAQHATADAAGQVAAWSEKSHVRILGRFVRDQHSRVVPQIAQSRVQPISRARRAAAYVISCNVRDSQGLVASMKRESGL